MSAQYEYAKGRSNHARCHAALSAAHASEEAFDSEPRYMNAEDLSISYPPEATFLSGSGNYQYTGHPFDPSCQATQHDVRAYREISQQHQAGSLSSTGWGQGSWQADAHDLVTSTPSTSASSNQFAAQGLPNSGTVESTIAQFEVPRMHSHEEHIMSDVRHGPSDSFWTHGSICPNPGQPQISQRQFEAEPWSLVNPRREASGSEYTYQGQTLSAGFSNGSDLVTASFFDGYDEDSMLREHQETSMETFNSEIEDIVESYAMSRELDGDGQCRLQVPDGMSHPVDVISPAGVAFRYRLDPAETPPETAPVADQTQANDSLVYLNPGDHHRPESHDPDQSSVTTGGSPMSITSASEPTVLQCSVQGCRTMFRGIHRRGNLGRHLRRKHRGSPGDHPCTEPHCPKTFNRSDSRLKHYRSHHPWLVPGPPILRGPQGTGSPCGD